MGKTYILIYVNVKDLIKLKVYSEEVYMHPIICMHEQLEIQTNCVCVSMYTNECNMQYLNNGFNKFKVDDSIHVKMLIVQ
jgi:hypothetical protein